MAAGAIPKLYNDAELTNEVTIVDGAYSIQVGPETGLDGNNGDEVVKTVYLANVGTEVYQSVVVTETGDAFEHVTLSKDGATYDPTTLTIGDIEVGGSSPIHIKVTVPAGAEAGANITVNLSITGESI